MARVLVTGGAGFIGSWLCERLVAAGDDVIVVDNLSSGSREYLAAVADKIAFIEADVRDLLDHADAFEGVTHIYHLAALISGYESLSTPDDYQDVNITGLQRVIDLAGRLPGVRVILASSSTVYGNQPEPVRHETTPPLPLTMYALTKLTGEHMLALYAPYHGFSHCSLRLFNVYGPRQSPNHPYANVTCKFAHAAATGQGVKRYGTGEQSRDFVYVDDVVDAFVAVRDAASLPIYNVGTGEEASINTLLEIVTEISGTAIPVEQCGPWPNDIRSIRASIGRIHGEFGFAPRVSLREGLARTVAYFVGQSQAALPRD